MSSVDEMNANRMQNLVSVYILLPVILLLTSNYKPEASPFAEDLLNVWTGVFADHCSFHLCYFDKSQIHDVEILEFNIYCWPRRG